MNKFNFPSHLFLELIEFFNNDDIEVRVDNIEEYSKALNLILDSLEIKKKNIKKSLEEDFLLKKSNELKKAEGKARYEILMEILTYRENNKN